MKTREQNRNNKRVRTPIWLVYRTDTNARGFWLVKRTLGWKTFIPENLLEIHRYFALTSYCNTIGQSSYAFSILWFLWGENEEAMFWSFHPWADKTNNEHLPKPFFKVIRKLLYLHCKKIYYSRSSGWDFFSSPCFAFFESHKIIWKQTEYAVVFDSSLAVAVTSSQMLKKC